MKKRGAIYSVVALMLCVAVYLNWEYTGGEVAGAEDAGNKVLGESVLVGNQSGADLQPDADANTDAENAEDYFAKARLSRQKARDEAINILNGTVENESADEAAKTAANTEIKLMADHARLESQIENLVVAKGYTDCVVFISEEGANVIVAKPEAGLQQTDVAKIKDIVVAEAAISPQNIKIIETAQ
jgi:stage III sporulation protein AH